MRAVVRKVLLLVDRLAAVVTNDARFDGGHWNWCGRGALGLLEAGQDVGAGAESGEARRSVLCSCMVTRVAHRRPVGRKRLLRGVGCVRFDTIAMGDELCSGVDGGQRIEP